VKLTTHLQLEPRSKNAWSYTCTSPVHLHGVVLSLKKSIGTTLTFTLVIFQSVNGNVEDKFIDKIAAVDYGM